MESIAIFADVQNNYYTVRDIFQAQFNYQSFWKEATTGREVISAFAYAIDSNNEKQECFQIKRIGKDRVQGKT